MSEGHSHVGGSVMHRVLNCPGSVQLSAKAPPQASSEYAEEGTMLHEVAATVLDAWRDRNPQRPDAVKAMEGISTEQKRVVMDYLDCVRQEHALLYRRQTPTVNLMIEHKFSIPGLHPDFYGTADAALLSSTAIRVIDLKCGRGVDVQADYDGQVNPQLGYYMLGVLHALGWTVTAHEISAPPGQEGVTDLEVIIVQPRRGGVKRRKVAIVELLDLAADMAYAVALAEHPNPPFRAGDWCRFCAAKPYCETYREKAYRSAVEDFPDPETLPEEELQKALDVLDLVEQWAKGVRAAALQRVQDGADLPGWTVKWSTPRRTWADEKAATEWLKAHGLPHLLARVRTVAETEKEMKKRGLDIGLLDNDTLIKRGSSTPSIAPIRGTPDPIEDFDADL